MKQFYGVFSVDQKLSPLVRELRGRQEKRPHENSGIGVLLCRNKDDEVVEMALSRSLSPARVAEYETRLIPKALLKQNLHEWGELFAQREESQ